MSAAWPWGRPQPNQDDVAPPVSIGLSTARLAVYLAWTAAMIPLQLLFHLASPRLVARFPVFYHRACCRILGIRLVTVGRPAEDGPVLYVANHISYLDITVYGALLEASFVAKTEVASWPLFGVLAKLQRSVFVDRRRAGARTQAAAVATRLQQGGNVILFPEGTSSDGTRVLPFRSSLLAAAETEDQDQKVTVQPVSLSYTLLDGMPIGRSWRPYIAWYGDMGLTGHFFRLLGLGRITARVQFHDTVTADQFASRKDLTLHCFETVARGHAAALAGRYGRA